MSQFPHLLSEYSIRRFTDTIKFSYTQQASKQSKKPQNNNKTDELVETMTRAAKLNTENQTLKDK